MVLPKALRASTVARIWIAAVRNIWLPTGMRWPGDIRTMPSRMSSSRMAALMSPFASRAVAGHTSLRPGV